MQACLAVESDPPRSSIVGELVAVRQCHGPDTPGIFRHAAVYVDKILKGKQPADLPVEQPTKLELIVDLKTAEKHRLPPRVKTEIIRELQRLELVLKMLDTVEAERDAIASGKNTLAHSDAKKIQDLVKLKCLGPEFASLLVGEVFYRSFAIVDSWEAMSG
jgi:hypothetical protein